MADASFIKSLFGDTPDAVKKAADQAFTYLLGNLTLGAPEDQTRAKNFQWYWYEATTSSVANQEFSFSHGLGRIPTVMIPVLPLGSVGAKTVNLEVSRAADASRVYLKSASTSASIMVLVE